VSAPARRPAKAHAAGLGELGHLGQRLALQAARQRAQREQPAAAELAGAELEHLHQAGLVEHGVGVGRADQAGHAAGRGGLQFALEHAFVLLPGLAQARGQVDQAGRHDQAAGVDDAVGVKSAARPGGCRWRRCGRRAMAMSATFVAAAGRVDHAAVANEDLHAWFPAMIDITAMRTAMPKVTCGRITLCAPSATGRVDLDAAVDRPGVHHDGVGLGQRQLVGVRP
jgi:hypothetical protein